MGQRGLFSSVTAERGRESTVALDPRLFDEVVCRLKSPIVYLFAMVNIVKTKIKTFHKILDYE